MITPGMREDFLARSRQKITLHRCRAIEIKAIDRTGQPATAEAPEVWQLSGTDGGAIAPILLRTRQRAELVLALHLLHRETGLGLVLRARPFGPLRGNDPAELAAALTRTSDADMRYDWSTRATLEPLCADLALSISSHGLIALTARLKQERTLASLAH